jgi:hypothetical protein
VATATPEAYRGWPAIHFKVFFFFFLMKENRK